MVEQEGERPTRERKTGSNSYDEAPGELRIQVQRDASGGLPPEEFLTTSGSVACER